MRRPAGAPPTGDEALIGVSCFYTTLYPPSLPAFFMLHAFVRTFTGPAGVNVPVATSPAA